MKFVEQDLKDVYLVNLEKMVDERGFFSRVYCQKEFGELALELNWVQMNMSFTKNKGTVRGIHWQNAPYTDAKLVRCTKGAVLDVVVDLRKDSRSYGKWLSVELNDKNHSAIYIPRGFGHGFQTLEHNCELLYFHSHEYVKSSEGGLALDDPSVGISWPLPIVDVSDRDLQHPCLSKINPIEI